MSSGIKFRSQSGVRPQMRHLRWAFRSWDVPKRVTSGGDAGLEGKKALPIGPQQPRGMHWLDSQVYEGEGQSALVLQVTVATPWQTSVVAAPPSTETVT